MGGFGAGIFGTSSETEPVRVFSFAINDPIECRRVFDDANDVCCLLDADADFVVGLNVALITGCLSFFGGGVKNTSSLSVKLPELSPFDPNFER